MIVGRVKRATEKSTKLRVRKDVSRMQWVLETDELQVKSICDRHRKKKGVDIEGKGEDGAAARGKLALRAQQRAMEEEEDYTAETFKKLPPMEQLVEGGNLMAALATAKSFGAFTLASKTIEQERKLKEEINSRVGKMMRHGILQPAANNPASPSRREKSMRRGSSFGGVNTSNPDLLGKKGAEVPRQSSAQASRKLSVAAASSSTSTSALPDITVRSGVSSR
jgi:hypothetical protein